MVAGGVQAASSLGEEGRAARVQKSEQGCVCQESLNAVGGRNHLRLSNEG